MRLEDVTAEIRPRVPWESIDLGCALARRHLGAVLKAWSLTVIPLWLLMALLLRNHPVLLILCVWWLKPIYDRIPLLVVSRALFGDVPKVMEVVRAWPKIMVRRLWFALVVSRFSPARSLSLPVAELEGLRGKAYSQRVDLLERNGGEGATMATLAGLLLEAVAGFGMIMFVMMIVPNEVSSRWFSGIIDFFNYSELADVPTGFFWLMALLYMATITLMAPFYVSAGFALYINSRTLTEGWDIELAFKRLGTRLASGGQTLSMLILVAIGFAFGGLAPVAHADDACQESIQEVVSDEDFTVYQRYVDVPVDDGSSSSGSWLSGSVTPTFMGVFGLILFYVILGLVIGGAIYLIYANRYVFQGVRVGRILPELPKTTAVMGMDVRLKSLPDDVAEAARKAWCDGDYQLALSLLYRGSIAWLIHRADLPIEEGDTEGDCLRRVMALTDGNTVKYFTDLTGMWIAVAYGKKIPDEQAMIELCDRWPFQRAPHQLERGAR